MSASCKICGKEVTAENIANHEHLKMGGSELAPATGSDELAFKPGEVVEVNGTAWLVWGENEQKHVMAYNLYGAVTVFPRSHLKRVRQNAELSDRRGAGSDR